MKKILPLLITILFFSTLVNAQTDKADLEALKAEKEAIAAAAAAEVADIQAKIDALPGWRFGGVGIVGMDFRGANNWFANEFPNSLSNGINFGITAFANNIQEKYFWRNGIAVNIGGQKFQPLDNNGIEIGESRFTITTDALTATSLFGYNIRPKLAISSLAELRTVVIGSDELGTSFFNPAYLDIGVGLTWTPIENLIAVFHPLNYNIVIADEKFDLTSSLGCKVVVDYKQALPFGVAWVSNLTAFLSYKSNEPSLHNATWTNGITYTAWKGIGVSAQLGLRLNEQEANKIGSLPAGENPLQSFWLIGLSYSLTR